MTCGHWKCLRKETMHSLIPTFSGLTILTCECAVKPSRRRLVSRIVNALSFSSLWPRSHMTFSWFPEETSQYDVMKPNGLPYVNYYCLHMPCPTYVIINMSMVSVNNNVWLGVFVCFYLRLCICSRVLVLHWTNLGPSPPLLLSWIQLNIYTLMVPFPLCWHRWYISLYPRKMLFLVAKTHVNNDERRVLSSWGRGLL